MRLAFDESGTRVVDDEDAIDRVLVDKAKDGDREAFAMLYRRHVASVYSFAFRTAGSKEVAEEVTSATFERALRSLAGFNWTGGGIRPWLLRIASVETSSWYRREQRSQKPRAQMILRELASEPSAPESLTFGFSAPEIHEALARVHPRYREAISLRYLSGLSVDDAAAAMGCSKTVLSVTLHRAVGALRRALAESAMREVKS